MTISIEGITFQGPGPLKNIFKNKSGVYVVLTRTLEGRYKILDVGESENIWERINSHERKTCWKRNAQFGGFISFAVFYCDERSRMIIEKKIRNGYKPVCGEI